MQALTLTCEVCLFSRLQRESNIANATSRLFRCSPIHLFCVVLYWFPKLAANVRDTGKGACLSVSLSGLGVRTCKARQRRLKKNRCWQQSRLSEVSRCIRQCRHDCADCIERYSHDVYVDLWRRCRLEEILQMSQGYRSRDT